MSDAMSSYNVDSSEYALDVACRIAEAYAGAGAPKGSTHVVELINEAYEAISAIQKKDLERR